MRGLCRGSRKIRDDHGKVVVVIISEIDGFRIHSRTATHAVPLPEWNGACLMLAFRPDPRFYHSQIVIFRWTSIRTLMARADARTLAVCNGLTDSRFTPYRADVRAMLGL